jgi:hypothetical protein
MMRSSKGPSFTDLEWSSGVLTDISLFDYAYIVI